MNDSHAQDSARAAQSPGEGQGAAPAGPAIPVARYRATLRLIRSRLVDETRSKPKPWWKRKP